MFYVNTDTKLFIAAPQSDSYIPPSFGCGCGDREDKPLFLSTCQKGPSFYNKIDKPVIYNYATNVLQFTFLDNEGLPYDLTDCTLMLAVDSTFSHSDSIAALADGDVLSPFDSIVEFKVNRFSKKFAQLLKAKVPPSQIWMEITAYKKDGSQNVLLQDRGIILATKLFLNEGITQDNLLNFYNKQQIDAFLMDLGRPDLIPNRGLVAHGEGYPSDSVFGSDDLYVDLLSKDLYLKLSDSVIFLGTLNMEDYYTKGQVNALLDDKASDSFVQDLNLQVQDLKQLHIAKLDTPQQGFAATYQLQDKNGSPLGASINIIQDKFLQGAALITATQEDRAADPSVVIGDPYLKFTFNTQPVSVIYVAVKDLVDTYNAGQGLLLQNHTFSIESDQQEDSIKFLQIGTNTIGLNGITAAIDKALSDASAYTDTKLQDYYTKSQTDAIVSSLSNSLSALRGELGNYYTKGEVNSIASSLSDSIEALKGELHGSYYNKTQVDALIAGISDSVDLSNYYTKSQVDGIASSLSNSFNSKLQGYYTKGQVDELLQQLSNSVDLSDYYTKGQVNAIAEALSDSIASIKSSFSNYYTRSEVDSITGALSNSIAALKQELHGSYYTSTQVDNITEALSDSIQALKNSLSNYYTSTQVDTKLGDYYTKSQVEGFLGSLSDSIQAVKSTFSQYYNKEEIQQLLSDSYYDKGEIGALIGTLSDSLSSLKQEVALQKDYNNLTNKPSIAGVTLQGNKGWADFGLPEFTGSSVSFSSVDADNCYTFSSNTVPVAVRTSKGIVYPIQKGSVEVDPLLGTVKFCADPYLIYDDEASFSGTWILYLAAGNFNFAVQSINGLTGRITLGAPDVGALQAPSDSGSQGQILVKSSDGVVWRNLPSTQQQIVTLTSTSIVPLDNKIYSKTLEASDSFSFDTTALTATHAITFELHLTQPSTAVTFTWPANIVWGDGTYFDSSNSAPDMSTTDMEYCIVIRWDGSDLLANLAYTKELS